MNRMTEAYCASCKSAKPLASFTPHVKIGEKYLPFCKQCCSAKLKEYTKKTGDPWAGLWCLLAEIGVPFLSETYKSTKNIIDSSTSAGRKPDLFLTYLRTIKELGRVVEGFWESDIMLSDLIKVSTSKAIVQMEKEKNNQISLKEQEKIWGKYTPEEYTFLNDTFDDYTRELNEMDTNLIRRYRDLAKAELRKRIADETGDIGEITKAQDSLNKQLSLLNLNDFKKKNDVDERRLFIDRIAWMIEETEPAEEEDESKYRDVAGYEKIYNSWMRSMRNILTGSRDYPDIPPEEK